MATAAVIIAWVFVQFWLLPRTGLRPRCALSCHRHARIRGLPEARTLQRRPVNP